MMTSSLTSCCLCLERMKEPIKTLPCLHSACSSCIEQLISLGHHALLFSFSSFFVLSINFFFPSSLLNLIGQKPFKCPLCRAVFEAEPESQAVWNRRNLFITHTLAT